MSRSINPSMPQEPIFKQYCASLNQRERQEAASALDVEDKQATTATNFFTSKSNEKKKKPLRESIVALSRLKGLDADMDCGEASTRAGQDSTEIHIDMTMGKENNYGTDHSTQLIIFHEWREYIDQLKKSKLDNKLMAMMSKTTLAIAAQVIGAVIANGIMSCTTTSPSWAVYSVEFAIFLGLFFTLVGLSLRGRRPALSTVLIKTGAMATASSIIISLSSGLRPAIAWSVAPLAFLLTAAAVSLSC